MNDDINITHTHDVGQYELSTLWHARLPQIVPNPICPLICEYICVKRFSHVAESSCCDGGGVYDPALSDDSIGCLSVFLLIDITFVECRRRRHVWKSVWNDVTKSCLCKWRIINWISYLRATQSNHSHLQRRGGLNGDHPTSSVWGVCVCMCVCVFNDDMCVLSRPWGATTRCEH